MAITHNSSLLDIETIILLNVMLNLLAAGKLVSASSFYKILDSETSSE
jgi:hypothetical protein